MRWREVVEARKYEARINEHEKHVESAFGILSEEKEAAVQSVEHTQDQLNAPLNAPLTPPLTPPLNAGAHAGPA
jgi:hypothetical protein